MKLLFVLAAVAVMLTGCATGEVGHKFDAAAESSLAVGVTTEAQARTWFGDPYGEAHSVDGRTRLTYMHASTKANGFTGRAKSDVEQLVLVFGADGKLQTYSTTGTPAAPR